MRKLKNYEQFNEGIKEWFDKTVNPGNQDKTIQNIFRKNIVPNFKIENLTGGEASGESRNYFYNYIIYPGTEMDVTLGGGEYNTPPSLYVGGKPYSVNRQIIKEIYNFFDKKYKMKSDHTNENILPKTFKKIKCLECGEEVCDTIDQKLWHLYNKHFKKSTLDEWEEKIFMKKYFGK